MANDDALLHNEAFPSAYRTCTECGLHAWHDAAYKPLRKAWANICYTCQIKQEVTVTRAKYDDALKGD